MYALNCIRPSNGLWIVLVWSLLSTPNAMAQDTQNKSFSPNTLKKLSVSELMNIEVTAVSKLPEKLSQTASAIQVITSEDIKHSAATRLPEVLRLAPNLQIAQTTSYGWAVSARGFNGAPLASGSLADKLLVMIDGRSVYTPLFAGVYWDVQNVLLNDIDRVEVVSGPGGTIWGANAVNGVINVVRKEAKETQGLYVSGAYGTFMKDHFGIRYGGKVGSKMYYRIYAQRMDYGETAYSDTLNAPDSWNMNQVGFRVDYLLNEANKIKVQGDGYVGEQDGNGPARQVLDGQNVMARWAHSFSETSNISLQLYFDRTWRRNPGGSLSEELNTYDVDFQHAVRLGKRNQIIWGAGYRYMQEKLDTAVTLIITPPHLNFYSINTFIKDEITIIPDKYKITVGAKLSDNYFAGLGLQPSGRMIWTPDNRNSVWAAISKSLRSPSRFDADQKTPIKGSRDFNWESVIAYEVGYRSMLQKNLSASLAIFYNKYHDLRSIEYNEDATGFVFGNNLKATTKGLEVSVNWQLRKWWKIRGGYTYLTKDMDSTSTRVIQGSDKYQALDPKHQAMVHAMMDLFQTLSLDITARYVSEIPVAYVLGNLQLSPRVPQYFNFDVRVAWEKKKWEVALIGQNLATHDHTEFAILKIPRNIYARITCHF